MSEPYEIWVLADDRAGNVSQCLGVAEALGVPFVRKDISYNGLAKLPNFILGASLKGLDKLSAEKIQAPWPDLVIGAGRRTAPVARYIKKASKGKTKLVQIMHPGKAGAAEFDLICVPSHDGKTLAGNEMEMLGAPHRVNGDKLRGEHERWQPVFASLREPRIALIVGGATKNKIFSAEMAANLGRQVNDLAEKTNGSVLVTTSRRTGNSADALMAEINVASHKFSWGDGGDNPYFGFLACADYLIVTGDSVSMCSEACATGKPVYIYAPQGMISEKHSRMVNALCEAGHARPFDGKLDDGWGKKLETLSEIVKRIKRMMAD